MSKPINSPLPWQLYNKDNKALQIISAEGVIVATVELAEPSLMEYDEWEANATLLLASVNAHSALVEALKAMIPACGFIVDRDNCTPCGLPATWVGSFHFRYCEKHHKERVDNGRGEGWLDEATAQAVAALALAESTEEEESK